MDNMYFGQNLIIKDLGNGISEVKYTRWTFATLLFLKWGLWINGLMIALVVTTPALKYTLPLLIPGLIFFILYPSDSFYVNAWGVSRDKSMADMIRFEDINSISDEPRGVILITKTKPVRLTSILRGTHTYNMILNIINEKSAYIRYK